MKVNCDLSKKKTGIDLCKADMQFMSAEMVHVLRWHFDTNYRKTKKWHVIVYFIRQVNKFKNLLLLEITRF